MVTFAEAFWCSALFFATVCYIFFRLKYSRQIVRWKECNIPFLPPVFLVGYKYLWDAHRRISIIAVLHRIHRENQDKDVLGFFMGLLPVILIKDKKLIHQVFVKNSDKTFNTHVAPLPDDIERQSSILLCSDKARWRADRAVLAPTFQVEKMAANFEKIEKQMDSTFGSAEKDRCVQKPFDVTKTVYSFFVDIVVRLNFGEYTNPLEEQTAGHNALNSVLHQSFFNFIWMYLISTYPSIQKIGFEFVPQKSFGFARNLLERKLKNWTENNREDNLLDILAFLKEKKVFAKQIETQDLDIEIQNEMIMRQMTGYAWVTLIGGSNGPMKTSVSTIHLLSLHPEYQDKIKMEIDQVMKKYNASKLTFDVIRDLRFTEQCVYEAARLITEMPFIARRCSEDFRVSGTEYTFRKGDMLIVCPHSINTDPRYFENPKTFYPERFNSVENWSSVTSDVLLSFGFGPRKCPGYSLGVKMVVMVVATMVSKYHIKPRSHLKEMTDPEDLDPKSLSGEIKGDLVVDLILR